MSLHCVNSEYCVLFVFCASLFCVVCVLYVYCIYMKDCVSLLEFLKVMVTASFKNPKEESPKARHVPDTGRKRVIPLFVVPATKESHTTISDMFKLLALPNSYKYILSPDLSALNKLLGLSTHSATYPCYCCTFNKNSQQNETQPRTLDSIRKNAKALKDAGPGAEHKNYFSCVTQPPPLPFKPEAPVETYVAPAALHIMLGLVNGLYHDLTDAIPDVQEWPKMLYLKPSGYHGGKDFNGNSCRKMLKNIHVLKTLLNQIYESSNVPASRKELVELYVTALQRFNSVVHSCFGTKLEKGWRKELTEFESAINEIFKFVKKHKYKLRSISPTPPTRYTPKMHILFEHAPRWIEITNVGLGSYSEQSFETAHHDFFKVWEKYKVGELTNPNYGKQLLRSVLQFASSHVPSADIVAFAME